jgi:WhiB family redox-sensing transcriptional regulator
LIDLNEFYGNHDVTWMDNASCANIPNPDIFFPPRDKELYKLVADEAKKFCFGKNGQPPCPVRKECLWYAIECNEEHGIWGGLSHRERNALVRKWQRQYKGTMTLKEYVFQLEKRRASNGSTKKRLVETPGQQGKD